VFPVRRRAELALNAFSYANRRAICGNLRIAKSLRTKERERENDLRCGSSRIDFSVLETAFRENWNALALGASFI